MPSPTIRAATHADARAIALVQVLTWRATYRGIVADAFIDSLTVEAREASWAERLPATPPDDAGELPPAGWPLVFVADDRYEVVGFVSGGRIRDPEPGYDVELYALYVLPGAQHGGVGSALTRTLARALVARGARAMIVEVLAANPARHFYESLGAVHLRDHAHHLGDVEYLGSRYGWPDLAPLARG